MLGIAFAGHLNLRPHRLGIHLHQGQVAVGGPAGDDLQVVAVLELLKGFDQVAIVLFPHLAHMVKFLGVVLRQVAQVTVVDVAVYL